MSEDQSRPSIEERRLTLDEEIQKQKLRLDEEVQRAKIRLDESRERREGRLIRANAAVLITALVTLLGLGLSGIQYLLTRAKDIDLAARESLLRQDEQRLKVLEYLTARRDDLFSKEPEIRLRAKAIIMTALPKEMLQSVFEQFHAAYPDDSFWVFGTTSAAWTRQGVGDCGGQDVGDSIGKDPEIPRCNVAFEGRVSVCWDGSEFKNGSRGPWCTYKSVTPSSCKGGSNPGQLFQCTLTVSPRTEK